MEAHFKWTLRSIIVRIEANARINTNSKDAWRQTLDARLEKNLG